MLQGKFGERCTLDKVEYFDKPAPYFACVFDAGNVVSSIRIVSPHMTVVTYKKVCFLVRMGQFG